MPTAPTRISYTDVAYNTVGTGSPQSKTSASVSWQTGDVVVVIAGAENSQSATSLVATGGGTGLAMPGTAQQSVDLNAAGCGAAIFAAVASGTGSGTITVTCNRSTADHFGFSVYVYRGSDGIGNSTKQSTTTKTVSLTPTAADSAIVWGVFDYNADTAGTATPTPTTTPQNAQDAAHYTYKVADLTDQTSAGAVSYGQSGGGTAGPFSIVVMEIKGAAAGGSNTNISPAQGTAGMTGRGTALGFSINMPDEL